MKTYNNLYDSLCSMGNLTLAWRNARKGKTLNDDIIEFEENIERNLLDLHYELKNKTYKPKPLTTFVLRDPKTRVISKSHFRDRVVHHVIILIVGDIFESRFIYDSCANQKKKGTLFALKRFDKFLRKVTNNFTGVAFCLKADIKQYFNEIDHEILLSIIKNKIADENVIWLIQQILNNTAVHRGGGGERPKSMPLGNLTSQFFANVYLDKFDKFVKHKLRVKYYIRYVDDFVILHKSRKQLLEWKTKIDKFLEDELMIKLHPQKSRIITLKRGVDFVGFRNYYKNRLLRKRNIKSMFRKIRAYKNGKMSFERIFEIYKGWEAYAKWSNSYKLRNKAKRAIIDILWNKV